MGVVMDEMVMLRSVGDEDGELLDLDGVSVVMPPVLDLFERDFDRDGTSTLSLRLERDGIELITFSLPVAFGLARLNDGNGGMESVDFFIVLCFIKSCCEDTVL